MKIRIISVFLSIVLSVISCAYISVNGTEIYLDEIIGETEIEESKYNKMDQVLIEKISESNTDTKLPVIVWIKDIDNDKILEQAQINTDYYNDLAESDSFEAFSVETVEDLEEYLKSTKSEREQELQLVQEFTSEKRSLAREEHIKSNNSFIEENGINDIIFISEYSPMIIARLTVSEISLLVKNDLVEELYYYTEPEFELECAESLPTINALYNRDTVGLTGNGVKIGQIDGGAPDTTNSEFSGVSITKLVSSVNSHATLVAGVMVGNNGMAPDAHLYSIDLGNLYDSAEELLNYNVQVINISAGITVSSYDVLSKWFDYMIYNHGVSMVKSAGNNGTSQCVTSPGLAYNCITVGGIDDNGTTTMSDNTLYSSTNMSYDGCRKPEVFAPAVSILSAGSTASGTSLAAPHVTGLIAQLIEAKPSIATDPRLIKALIMAGAHDFTGNTYTQTSTFNSVYCAGLIDSKISFKILTNSKYVVDTLTTESNYIKTLSVPSSWNFIRVALVWDMKMSESNAISNGNGTLADMDVLLIDPNGNAVEGSCGVGNSYEFFYYPIAESGTYKLMVIRRSTDTTTQKFALTWY